MRICSKDGRQSRDAVPDHTNGLKGFFPPRKNTSNALFPSSVVCLSKLNVFVCWSLAEVDRFSLRLNDIKREAELLQKMEHPNIAALLHYWCHFSSWNTDAVGLSRTCVTACCCNSRAREIICFHTELR